MDAKASNPRGLSSNWAMSMKPFLRQCLIALVFLLGGFSALGAHRHLPFAPTLATMPFRIAAAQPANAQAIHAQTQTGKAQPRVKKQSGEKARSTKTPADRKPAQALQDPAPQEIRLRRVLSQDGKTLLLIPEQPLPLGASFRLAVDGLQSLGGEPAPALLRHFHTPAQAPQGAVDFKRITLTYPDEAFNLTVTIPQGAVPPGAAVQVEAPAMGSIGTGTMLEGRDLAFPMKASLGERLRILVQLPSGEIIEGFVSRYESADGSGRVTLGLDGGRIQAPDGSGAAVTLPEGALEGPVELRVEVLQGVPEDLDPEISAREKLVGRLELRSSGPVVLHKRPVVEMKAPENPSTVEHPDGLGPYSVYYRIEGFETDGTPAVYFELNDTAALADGKLRSKGGLPDHLTLPEGATSGGEWLMPDGLRRSIPLRPVGNTLQAVQKQGPEGRVKPEAMFMPGLLEYAIFAVAMYEAGPQYLAGSADLSIGGGERKPAEGASIFFANSLPVLKRAGQMLGRTDSRGSYLFASFLTQELIRGGGLVMGIERDFGVREISPGAPSFPTMTGTYIRVPALHFEVRNEDMADRLAPYTELNVEADKSTLSQDWVVRGTELAIKIQARDNRAGDLGFGLRANGQPLDLKPATATRSGMQAKQAAYAPGQPGSLRIEAAVTDAAGNRTVLSRDLHVVDFQAGEEAPGPLQAAVTPASPVQVQDWLRVAFSQSVVLPDAQIKVVQAGTEIPIQVVRMAPEDQKMRVLYVRPRGAWIAGREHALLLTHALFPEGSRVFRFLVQGPQGLGDAQLAGTPIGAMAALGSRVFVGISRPEGQGIQVFRWTKEGALKSAGTFGPLGTGSFLSQQITAMKAFRGVPLGSGGKRDLLLVITAPRLGDWDHQSVLWAFTVCEETVLDMDPVPAQVSPTFALSLGPGAMGYSPSLDQRNGLIAVGRLCSSVLLVSAQAAYEGWYALSRDARGMVSSPVGANAGAIVQPFYLADPVSSWFAAHWGVGLLGTLQPGADEVAVAVSTSNHAQRSGLSMDGAPLSLHGWASGRTIQSPFIPLGAGDMVDARAWPGPIQPPGGAAAGSERVRRLASWPEAAVSDPDGSHARIANLLVGVNPKPAPDQAGNSLVVMEYQHPSEADPQAGRVVGQWPDPGDPPLAPSGTSYELIGSDGLLSLDALNGLCTVGLKMGSETRTAVLDLKHPGHPVQVASLGRNVVNAAIWNGVVYQVENVGGAYALEGYRVAPAAQDSGGCALAEKRQRLIDAQDAARKNRKFKGYYDEEKKRWRTFCNLATAWTVDALGGPTDPLIKSGQTPYEPGYRANDMADNLAHSDLYREVSKEEAQQLANEGETVIGAQKNPNPKESGHVATVRPEGVSSDEIEPGRGPLINQIGKSRMICGTTGAFDKRYPVLFYTPRRP